MLAQFIYKIQNIETREVLTVAVSVNTADEIAKAAYWQLGWKRNEWFIVA